MTSLRHQTSPYEHNPTIKEVVNSIAGTRPKSVANRFRDLRSDLGIVLGTDRYGERTSEVKAVVEAANKSMAFHHIR
jgi:hypothetical protein